MKFTCTLIFTILLLNFINAQIVYPNIYTSEKRTSILKINKVKSVYQYHITKEDTTQKKLTCILHYNQDGLLTDSILGENLIKDTIDVFHFSYSDDTTFINKKLSPKGEDYIGKGHGMGLYVLSEYIDSFDKSLYQDSVLIINQTKINNSSTSEYTINTYFNQRLINVEYRNYNFITYENNRIPDTLFFPLINFDCRGHFYFKKQPIVTQNGDQTIYVIKETGEKLITYGKIPLKYELGVKRMIFFTIQNGDLFLPQKIFWYNEFDNQNDFFSLYEFEYQNFRFDSPLKSIKGDYNFPLIKFDTNGNLAFASHNFSDVWTSEYFQYKYYYYYNEKSLLNKKNAYNYDVYNYTILLKLKNGTQPKRS